MKKQLLFVALSFAALVTQAQQLTPDQSQLSFLANSGNKDSIEVTLTNTSAAQINVVGTSLFSFYGDDVYSVSESTFSINSNESKTVWVYFEPRHNILHNSELVFLTDHRGAISIDLQGEAHLGSSYYSGTYNLEEQALKSELKSIISSGFNSQGYNGARDAMYMVLDNKFVNGQGATQNELEGVYTGLVISGYTNRTAAQNMGVNTEHTYPQSMFNSNEPMRSDIHHLYITKANANTQRSNLPFGEVNSAAWEEGGSKRGGGKFEPRDVHKGQVARAMFYFVTRYQNYNDFLTSQETVLREWADLFPPTAVDMARNNGAENVQGNRNPYIDYPLFLERITSISKSSVAPANNSQFLPEDEINYGTLYGGNADHYQFVVVNDGNVELKLSDIQIDDFTESVTLIDPPADTLRIQPGEAGIITVSPITPGSGPVNTSMSFISNATGGKVTVPIFVDLSNGLAENPFSNAFQLFPNPTQEQVTIRTKGTAIGQLEVMDLTGRVIWQKDGQQTSELRINTASWSRGTYLVKQGQYTVKKLIVTH